MMYYLIGWIGVSLYAVILIVFSLKWLKTKAYVPSRQPRTLSVSVIVPIRNEEKNIIELLESLNQQTFKDFEVIIMNDHSTDKSVELIKEYQKNHSLSIKIIDLPHTVRRSHKKTAIELGLASAKGEWIQLTDGDCVVDPFWLETTMKFQAETNAKLISGGVVYQTFNFWSKLLAMEFLSPVGVGAVSMLLRKPTMCNGANLGFLKAIFHELEGYKGNENLSSGDDEFLMHKVVARYPKDVHYLKSKENIVRTIPPLNLSAFIQQRIRWASKWKNYQNVNSIIAGLFIFCFHLYFVLSPILILCHFLSFQQVFFLFLLRLNAEFLFLGVLSKDFSLRRYIGFIPIIALVYSFYAVLIGLRSLKGNYHWKDRFINTKNTINDRVRI